jgi:hypothetical protein
VTVDEMMAGFGTLDTSRNPAVIAAKAALEQRQAGLIDRRTFKALVRNATR